MKKSKYMKYMTESYIYEAEDDKLMKKVIGKNDKGNPVTVRQALDSNGKNPTMAKLKKKAQGLKDKDKGAEDTPKAKPKTTAISTTGGLGGDDEEKPDEEPSGEEPSGEEPGDGSDKDPKVQAAHKTAADIQGDDSIYRHTDRRRYALEKMTKKEAEETQETLSAESQRSEEKGTNEFKGKTPITSDDVPEGKYHSGDPYDEFVWDSEKDREDFLEAKAAASSWYTMTHPSEGGSYGRPIDIKWKEGEQEESITINGKKYRSIKESKKPNKRVLKENYDRIFRSRK